MKKLLSFLFVLVLAFALVSCGGKEKPTPSTPDTPDTPSTPDTPTTPDTPAETTGLPAEYAKLLDSHTGKVYLTCAGQADQEIVQNLINRASKQAGLTLSFSAEATADVITNNLLDAETVEDGSVVFLAVGGSNKGISGAGSNSTKETARASKLAEKARDGKITLFVFHVGGESRRGALSDTFIQAAAPSANVLFYVASGDIDGYFAGLSGLVTTVKVNQAAELLPILKGLWA